MVESQSAGGRRQGKQGVGSREQEKQGKQGKF